MRSTEIFSPKIRQANWYSLVYLLLLLKMRLLMIPLMVVSLHL